jgi:hypothetical protein
MVHTVDFVNEETASDYIHVPASISALPGEYLRYFLFPRDNNIHCVSHTKQWRRKSTLVRYKMAAVISMVVGTL